MPPQSSRCKPSLESSFAGSRTRAEPLPRRYGFGTGGAGGGRSRAWTSSVNPTTLWVPSQKGLLAEWPQRQSEIFVRPASPKGFPPGSTISKSPSTRSGPLCEGVIFVAAMDSRAVPRRTCLYDTQGLAQTQHAGFFALTVASSLKKRYCCELRTAHSRWEIALFWGGEDFGDGQVLVN